jgi:hypothetical protein
MHQTESLVPASLSRGNERRRADGLEVGLSHAGAITHRNRTRNPGELTMVFSETPYARLPSYITLAFHWQAFILESRRRPWEKATTRGARKRRSPRRRRPRRQSPRRLHRRPRSPDGVSRGRTMSTQGWSSRQLIGLRIPPPAPTRAMHYGTGEDDYSAEWLRGVASPGISPIDHCTWSTHIFWISGRSQTSC